MVIKKVFSFAKRFYYSERLRFVIHILLLIGIPLLLTLPLPLYAAAYKLEVTSQLPQPDSVGVPVYQQMQSIGVTFFSKISGISSYSYSTYLCVFNRNKTLLNNKVVNPKELVDGLEAGAMELTIEYPDGHEKKLYVPPRFMPTCSELLVDISTSTPAYLKNYPIFRNPLPFGKPIYESSENGPQIKIPVYEMSGIDPADTKIFVLPGIFSRAFCLNFIIFFLAWSIIYTHLMVMWKEIKVKYKKAFKN